MSTQSQPQSRPFRILVVCTANICRSVIAERLLRREAAVRGLDLEVSSCGLLLAGRPATDTVIALLDDRGLDVRDHRSRVFTPEVFDGIDLVVSMERMHVRELANVVDGSTPKTHTLGSIVAWLRDPDRSGVGASPAELVAACAEQRRASDLLGGGRDEIEDPHGRSRRIHRKAIDTIEDRCRGLLDGLFPV